MFYFTLKRYHTFLPFASSFIFPSNSYSHIEGRINCHTVVLLSYFLGPRPRSMTNSSPNTLRINKKSIWNLTFEENSEIFLLVHGLNTTMNRWYRKGNSILSSSPNAIQIKTQCLNSTLFSTIISIFPNTN